MAIGDPYADLARYRAQRGSTATGADAVITSQLNAVSRWIERKLGRVFNKDAAATTRIYIPQYTNRGLSPSVLRIDDTVSMSAVKVDTTGEGVFGETALTSTYYQLLPLNAASGPEAWPYTQIEATTWGSQNLWAVGTQIQVTGIHGWPAVPEAIVNACVEFTAMLKGESPFATQAYQSLDQAVSQDWQARALLKGLIDVYHPTGVVVA